MDVKIPGGSYLAPSLDHATAGDAMRPQVLTCTPDTPLITAAQRMAGEHIHALVVLRHDDDDGGRAWAVLTDRDILHHAQDAETMTAGEAASEAILTAQPADRLTELARRMVRHAVSHALIVDPRTDRPVGVVSTLDIAGIIAWGRA